MKKDELRFEALKLALTRHGQNAELPIVFQTADKFLAYINQQVPSTNPATQTVAFTEEQLTELITVSKDAVEFAKMLKIVTVDHGLVPLKPYSHQELILKTVDQHQSVVVTAARQLGTSTTVAVSVLHQALYTNDQTILVVSPSLAGSLDFLDRLKLMYETLPDHLRVKTQEYNKTTIVFENGSRIIARAASRDAGRGMGINMLVVQDAAWMSHSYGREFWEGIYPCISSGHGARCIVYSAAHDTDGIFYELNQNTEKNGFHKLTLPWHHRPDWDDAWATATRAMIGKADFARQFECKFVPLDKGKKAR